MMWLKTGRSILKNNQNTYYPSFSFTPKTGTELPETGVLFLLCNFLIFYKALRASPFRRILRWWPNINDDTAVAMRFPSCTSLRGKDGGDVICAQRLRRRRWRTPSATAAAVAARHGDALRMPMPSHYPPCSNSELNALKLKQNLLINVGSCYQVSAKWQERMPRKFCEKENQKRGPAANSARQLLLDQSCNPAKL